VYEDPYNVAADVSSARASAVAEDVRVAEATARRRAPLPYFNVESFGLQGNWVEMGGNFLLRYASKLFCYFFVKVHIFCQGTHMNCV
jgi:hypothetical protein